MASDGDTDETRLDGRRGHATVKWLGDDVLLAVFTGYVDTDLGERIVELLSARCSGRKNVQFFNDCEHMVGYDPVFRRQMTDWATRFKDALASDHVLVRSKIVAMGISVASLVTGSHIEVYARRSAFEEQLARALAATAPPTG